MRKYALLPLLALLLLVASCQQLGLTPPQTTEERIAYGITQVKGLQLSAAHALTAKVISKADAMNVLQLADAASDSLHVARALSTSGDASGALKNLQLAEGVIAQLQKYLTAKGVN